MGKMWNVKIQHKSTNDIVSSTICRHTSGEAFAYAQELMAMQSDSWYAWGLILLERMPVPEEEDE